MEYYSADGPDRSRVGDRARQMRELARTDHNEAKCARLLAWIRLDAEKAASQTGRLIFAKQDAARHERSRGNFTRYTARLYSMHSRGITAKPTCAL